MSKWNPQDIRVVKVRWGQKSFPIGTVYVGRGRGSKWGNPYEIGRDGTREEVIAKYREWILARPHLIEELRALNPTALACWCAPLACHADVLRELLCERL